MGYLRVQQFHRQTNGSFREVLLGVAAEAVKKQPSGNEVGVQRPVSGRRDGADYEQGGSSDGVRGLHGGTVLRERKAKMEGS